MTSLCHTTKEKDMFKKHRQDCQHPKNAQFDIYAITSNFFDKFQWNFAKKFDNHVTNPTTKKKKKKWWKKNDENQSYPRELMKR